MVGSKLLLLIHVELGRSFKDIFETSPGKELPRPFEASACTVSNSLLGNAVPQGVSALPTPITGAKTKQWAPTASFSAAWTPVHEFAQKSELHWLFLFL